MTAGKPRFGIVVFPGSNCDQDCHYVVTELLGCDADYVWHRDTDLKGADIVILPGGFAYGDYLRAGALARFSPVMETVIRFAMAGGPVLGICNGFQVLLEAGLLPGAVRVNRGLRYVCKDVHMRVENASTA
ncbi:MAG TPA: phosphoribosylformylglycinamidine synthase subunit PurQ, partial [Thermoanaerobaculia bacterium]|nr:phosphoribosylformylglycinamidine synthase subunit PurQ [Thermoanaerobaculia bacterium]